MALAYCFLSSGSCGNCLFVQGGGAEILVDCGLSARAIGRGLDQIGRQLEHVHAVVCTHSHSDHVAGASVLARRHGKTIWATAETADELPDIPANSLRTLPRGGSTRIAGLQIESVPTSHDSAGSVALVLDDGECRLGVVTDLGVVTPEIVEALQGVDGLVLEMNHDLEMLATGPYPEYLKRRIRGRFGHLSNEQGAELLARVHGPELQQVTLAHLSEHNNTERLAQVAAARVLEEVGSSARLDVARPRQVGQPVELRRRTRRRLLGF